MQQIQTSPKFSIGQSVIYRVETPGEKYDIPGKILEVVHTQTGGYFYKIDFPKGTFKSNIKPEKDLRLGIKK